MKKFVFCVVALATLCTANFASAHGRFWGGFVGGAIVGSVIAHNYYRPYYYQPYVQPVFVQPQVIYTQPAQVVISQQPQAYFCAQYGAYYPQVQQCPSGWQITQ